MPLFASLDPIKEQTDIEWTDAREKRAQSLLNGVQGWIARNAPCLVDENGPKAAEARMIVAEAIIRAIDSTGNIGSEGIGPSQVNYIDRAALPTLTRGEEAQLRALCPRAKNKRYGTIRTRPGY